MNMSVSYIDVTENVDKAKGLKLVCEPEMLRFFKGRFEEID
ncbi:MAG TPA: hypothetical protein PLF13_01605 [candidate division Zixibacteria bacterium]|nr:hypothetical protein [candidate division Zixibacteria bacterium]